MSGTRGRGAHLAGPGTAKGRATGRRWDWTRAQNEAETDGCAVLLCVHAGRGEPRGRKHSKKKNKNKTPQRLRRACGTKRAGGGGTGRSKRADEGPRVAKKNHSNEKQCQQRRVTTWGRGKSNGGRGGQEEGPTTGPEWNTPRKRKGAGRGRPELGTRTGPGKAAAMLGLRQGVAGGPKKKRDAGKRGRDRKGRVARAARRPQGTRTAWEAAQEQGAGAGREQPVLGARNGPRMDEDPVGPRHRVAGGLVGYKHEMGDGMRPHNSPGE